MNNDLISRSAVLQIIYEIKDNPDTPKNYGTLLDIIRQIRELPVAFDKEKVMAELYKKYNKLTDITIAVGYILKPDGERVDVNRYFKEGDSVYECWDEIERKEYEVRKEMDRKRRMELCENN